MHLAPVQLTGVRIRRDVSRFLLRNSLNFLAIFASLAIVLGLYSLAGDADFGHFIFLIISLCHGAVIATIFFRYR